MQSLLVDPTLAIELVMVDVEELCGFSIRKENQVKIIDKIVT